MAGKQGRNGWGWVRRLPSKRYQASYCHPPMTRQRHYAPTTFTAKLDAQAWLAGERRLIEHGTWQAPAVRAAACSARHITVAEYGAQWIEHRSLKPRTKQGYEDLLRLHITPTPLGKLPVAAATPHAVRTWHANLGTEHPTRNKHAYGLLHAIMRTAVTDEILTSNPCHVSRAMNVSRKREPVILTVGELAAVAGAVPERLRALVLISAWCGLRWGEVIELRRNDIGEGCEVITVARGATHRGECRIDTPKSGKIRSVVVPPHIRADIKHHLDTFAGESAESLVFPPARGGCHLNDKVFRSDIAPALDGIGRSGMRIHDLRHFAGTMAASVGSLTETMARLGHSTAKASLMYQGRVSGADMALAVELSRLATEPGAG